MSNMLIETVSKRSLKQIDCFKKHFRFFKVLGIWPSESRNIVYTYYSRLFVFTFIVLFLLIYTVNFFFLPRQLEIYADEMIFYFTELSVFCKVFTVIFMNGNFKMILKVLESDIFQPNTAEGLLIVEGAKKRAQMYWRITAGISYVSNTANVLVPMIMHIIFSVELQYPVCNYSFIPEKYKSMFSYPAYVYQGLGITSHMFYNVNFDTFLLGVMILAIGQLDILDENLRKVTEMCDDYYSVDQVDCERRALEEINKCIKHYDEIYRFCKLIQDTFSKILFLEFSLGSGRLCACLFRFTLPAPTPFYIFLSFYMTVMILQIMVPCWFGTRIIEKSKLIAYAVYDCDWTLRTRPFKTNLLLLVERAQKPITISGGKMFLLSLGTFTSITNSAYSFFTLFRHMQSR